MSDSVERFTTSCCEYGGDVATPKDDGWLVRYEDYERLRARLEEAELDAKRYEFVLDKMVSVEWYVPFMLNDAWVRVKTFDGKETFQATLNEAIDALATPTATEDA